MKTIKLYINLILIILITFIINCDNLIKSEEEEDQGPRNYEWSHDTINHTTKDIWGDSMENIRLVGGSPHSYKYIDGKWIVEYSHIVALNEYWNINSVWGDSSNNLYTAGDKKGDNIWTGQVLHYDGYEWSEIPIDSDRLFGIWGTSSSDIWVGGVKGSLQHYNGVVWTKYDMPESIYFSNFAGFTSNDIYCVAYGVSNQSGLYLYHWNGTEWSLLSEYHGDQSRAPFNTSIEVIDGELYSCGHRVTKYDRETKKWSKIFTGSIYLLDICGTSSDNIFAVGLGGAYHYNGIDLHLYDDIDGTCLSVWTDGKEVVIGGKGIVHHGKSES